MRWETTVPFGFFYLHCQVFGGNSKIGVFIHPDKTESKLHSFEVFLNFDGPFDQGHTTERIGKDLYHVFRKGDDIPQHGFQLWHILNIWVPFPP